jgi:hypothetical protein
MTRIFATSSVNTSHNNYLHNNILTNTINFKILLTKQAVLVHRVFEAQTWKGPAKAVVIFSGDFQEFIPLLIRRAPGTAASICEAHWILRGSVAEPWGGIDLIK